MLQKVTLGDRALLPFSSNLHQKLHPNHGIWDFNCSDLKFNENFEYPTCRLSLMASFFKGQLLIKRRGFVRRCSIVFAKLQDKEEPETNTGKVYGYYSMFHSVMYNSLTNLFPECRKPEEGFTCKLSHSKGHYDCHVDLEEVLLEKLKAVHLHLLASERWNASQLKLCHRNYLVSAINLTHYLALQSLDINQLQQDLSSLSLLNLDDANPYILASISACIQLLEKLISKDLSTKEHVAAYTEYLGEFAINAIQRRIASHVGALFSPGQDKRNVHIMVTVGREVISNEMLLGDLLRAGADVIRINCAHDDSTVWSEIIRIARHSSQMLEKPFRILMDLGGSKLRTGHLKVHTNAIRITTKKSAMGEFLPAQFWLCCDGSSPPAHLSPDAILYIDQKFSSKLKVGNVLRFTDLRGKKRAVKVVLKSSAFGRCGYMAESLRSVYIGLGTEFYIKNKGMRHLIGTVVKMPPLEPFIRLNVGDVLTICRDSSLSMDENSAPSFGSTAIACCSGHLFNSVKAGEPIAFDDGKIWGEIRKTNPNEITVLITRADPKGSKLGPGKSINIPMSEMHVKGLTSKDLVDLEFIAANADMVGISFIRDDHDMIIIQHELEKRKLHKLGVVLKIETRDAFEKLPLILLQAMQMSNPLGVMIARGDLMVECGWEKMASIQEEVLSLCNAAHIPVIWATQVLDSLVKFGLPTRAEITDVACGMRTSCIMLNKGEYIVEAVSAVASMLSNDDSGRNTKSLLNPVFQSALPQ